MLASVIDRTGAGGSDRVRAAIATVEARLAARGQRVAWPIAAEIVPIPVMGATKSPPGRHTLFLSADAVRSSMLEGLIAHEMGHMIRTEERHPSHDPAVFKRMAQTIHIPREAEAAFADAFNHVQDVFADDIAFLAGLDDRAYRFFAGWVRGNASLRGGTRWRDVGLCVSNGFALGNLARHGLLRDDDALWSEARAFDRVAGLEAVGEFAEFFRALPTSPTAQEFLERVRFLVEAMRRAGDGRA